MFKIGRKKEEAKDKQVVVGQQESSLKKVVGYEISPNFILFK
jgi:hypothetical protein